MTRLIRHEPADLVATVEAGMTFAAFNETTARAGQWLPLDPPDDGRASVGGVVATGTGGAQAFAYGNPRGFVLGMHVLLADGRQTKAGGNVVKNVAGYDLCKLFTGSYGTLGLITELTCKLRPRPAREATLIVRATDAEILLNSARQLRAGQFLPVALELLAPAFAPTIGVPIASDQFALLVRFAGNDTSVADQAARAHALFNSAHAVALELVEPDAHLWRALAAEPLRTNAQLIWRASVRPANLPALLIALGQAQRDHAAALSWHAGLGDGRLRVVQTSAADAPRAVATLTSLRDTARRLGGSLIVERAPVALRRAFDAWAVPEAHARLMLRVKRQLDPAGLLAADGFFASESQD
jgi:FAD/FMN-containing dehydrogenase